MVRRLRFGDEVWGWASGFVVIVVVGNGVVAVVDVDDDIVCCRCGCLRCGTCVLLQAEAPVCKPKPFHSPNPELQAPTLANPDPITQTIPTRTN